MKTFVSTLKCFSMSDSSLASCRHIKSPATLIQKIFSADTLLMSESLECGATRPHLLWLQNQVWELCLNMSYILQKVLLKRL